MSGGPGGGAPLEAAAMSRGPRLVRRQIVAHARRTLPLALSVSRQQWELSSEELADPLLWSPYELPAVGDDAQMPALCVALGRSDRYVRTDVLAEETFAEQYQVRYPATVYLWLKASDARPDRGAGQGVQQLRDDYATVLQSIFLAGPTLSDPSQAFLVDETTMQVDYSVASKVAGDRWMAGVSVAFSVTHDETLRRVPVGTADHIGVEATLLPGQPQQ